jgi:hypothetical protein
MMVDGRIDSYRSQRLEPIKADGKVLLVFNYLSAR